MIIYQLLPSDSSVLELQRPPMCNAIYCCCSLAPDISLRGQLMERCTFSFSVKCWCRDEMILSDCTLYYPPTCPHYQHRLGVVLLPLARTPYITAKETMHLPDSSISCLSLTQRSKSASLAFTVLTRNLDDSSMSLCCQKSRTGLCGTSISCVSTMIDLLLLVIDRK